MYSLFYDQLPMEMVTAPIAHDSAELIIRHLKTMGLNFLPGYSRQPGYTLALARLNTLAFWRLFTKYNLPSAHTSLQSSSGKLPVPFHWYPVPAPGWLPCSHLLWRFSLSVNWVSCGRGETGPKGSAAPPGWEILAGYVRWTACLVRAERRTTAASQ